MFADHNEGLQAERKGNVRLMGKGDWTWAKRRVDKNAFTGKKKIGVLYLRRGVLKRAKHLSKVIKSQKHRSF